MLYAHVSPLNVFISSHRTARSVFSLESRSIDVPLLFWVCEIICSVIAIWNLNFQSLREDGNHGGYSKCQTLTNFVLHLRLSKDFRAKRIRLNLMRLV